MNMMKKVFAVVLCIALFASLSAVSMMVSAEEITVVDGVRWFPVPENRQNDDAWEVECVKEGCLCQRFTETAEETGNANFLDTVWDANGGLTITRNGNDATEGNYWPRIRTISLETSPELDLKVANTFYFDFTAAEGTQWNLMLSINGMNVKLSKVVSDAAGVPGPTTSDEDGIAGSFKGSINIQDALAEIAKETNTESSVNATALLNMKKTFVPQIAVFCVGPVGATMTINEMFISTPEDTTGEKTTLVDMGLLTGLGEEWYLMNEGDEPATEDEPANEDEPAVEDEPDVEDEPATDEPAGEDEPAIDEPASPDEGPETDGTEADTTPTTAPTTTKAAANDGGDNNMVLIIVGAAVAVVAIIVVVVIVMKKKKA